MKNNTNKSKNDIEYKNDLSNKNKRKIDKNWKLNQKNSRYHKIAFSSKKKEQRTDLRKKKVLKK